MRRTFTRSAAISSIALAAVFVLAGPAEARRNVGGTDPVGSCIKPGVINLGDQARSSTPCICYSNGVERFHFSGRGDCPSGIPEIKIDRRNVGG
jgi:hypothetical protein